MAQVKDPVCGMLVDTESAAYANFMGTMYYFCSAECRDQFGVNPTRYAAKSDLAEVDNNDPELEKHEPPFTKKGPIVAPKFGSAGSGGLEFEPGPERHGKEP
ncbi:MAG: YHS domain-containing protein [Gemmatimonadota bacterium]